VYDKYFIGYILLIVILSGCNPTKKQPERKFLLTENKIEIEPEKQMKASEIQKYILQTPNKKFLGMFHINLWLYNETANWKASKFRDWLRRLGGKPPAIYDPNLTLSSERNIKNYLYNKGYFNATIKSQEILQDKKAEVVYHIKLNKSFKIRNFLLEAEDTLVSRYANRIMANTPIRPGEIYDYYVLEGERERLTVEMRNAGFYFFTNDYIFYEIDTTIGQKNLDIRMLILNPSNFTGFDPGRANEWLALHHLYKIRNIYVFPQYSSHSETNSFSDTLVYNRTGTDDTSQAKNDILYLIYNEPLKIQPKIISQAIYIHSGDLYCLRNADLSFRALAEFPIYRSINIEFRLADTAGISLTRHGHLDCYIYLSRAEVQGFTIETEVTNTGGDLGLSGNLVYTNRNVFRGAEMLRLKLRGAAEMQKSFEQTSQNKLLLFNTYESGAELNLTFPRFVWPLKGLRFPSSMRTKSNLLVGYNYQNRPDYIRHITNAAFSYQLKVSDFKSHLLTPLELNAIKIYATPSFQQLIDSIDDQGIRSQYSDHLIPALRYSYIFTNQEIGKFHNYKYFRFDFESSGNTLYAVDRLTNVSPNIHNEYTFLGIAYAQYLKASSDFRYFYMFNLNNTLVMRIFAGAAIPYGNSNYLPFEKGFFAGGANGMRGWTLRMLGPGHFSSEGGQRYNRMGDLHFETNLEYRFPMYNFFKGAFFLDAGNIWLVKSNPMYPGGLLNARTFLKEIAMDAGIGIRLDFTYFVFRLDAALPLLDPARPEGSRWLLPKSRLSDLVWNFGIGYPF